MATNYPGAVDSFVNPTATDTLDSATVPHAAQHDNINDAMSAVQVTLGVNPQGSSATVVARLTALDSTVAGKAATNQTMYVGTTALTINRSSASQTLTGVSVDGNAANVTGTVAVANGGTGVTASTGANSVMLRDTNQNTTINNIAFGTATTVTNASTPVTLTVASPAVQNFTGSANQTVNMPDATTLPLGYIYYFNNRSNSTVSLKYSSSGGTIYIINGGGATQLTLISNSTVDGTWQQSAFLPSNVYWGTSSLDASSASAKFANITDSALSTAGIVTNTSAGLLGTVASVPTGNLPSASTSGSGIVTLTDSTSSTSTTTAATPNSVKTSYDLANAALPKSGGTLSGQLAVSTSSTSSPQVTVQPTGSFTKSVTSITYGTSVAATVNLSDTKGLWVGQVVTGSGFAATSYNTSMTITSVTANTSIGVSGTGFAVGGASTGTLTASGTGVNVQEWQSSTGTAVSSVDGSGNFTTLGNVKTSSGTNSVTTTPMSVTVAGSANSVAIASGSITMTGVAGSGINAGSNAIQTTGNISGATITATTFSGSGASLTSIPASAIASVNASAIASVNGSSIVAGIATITGTTYSVGATDYLLICNNSATLTITLPTASSYTGRVLKLVKYNTSSIVSASSNVGSLTAGTAQTTFFTSNALAGRFCEIISNGTVWQIVAQN